MTTAVFIKFRNGNVSVCHTALGCGALENFGCCSSLRVGWNGWSKKSVLQERRLYVTLSEGFLTHWSSCMGEKHSFGPRLSNNATSATVMFAVEHQYLPSPGGISQASRADRPNWNTGLGEEILAPPPGHLPIVQGLHVQQHQLLWLVPWCMTLGHWEVLPPKNGVTASATDAWVFPPHVLCVSSSLTSSKGTHAGLPPSDTYLKTHAEYPASLKYSFHHFHFLHILILTSYRWSQIFRRKSIDNKLQS